MKPSIFQFTHQKAQDHVFAHLGKGRDHGGLVYSQWFRKGFLPSVGSSSSSSFFHPAFNNCPALLEEISSLFDFSLLELAFQREEEQTLKIVFRTFDHLQVETVVIPMQAGLTVCVSSQVGCRLKCQFCETGKMGRIRNLTSGEIVSQVFQVIHQLKKPIRNVVFMGMGEPLDNYDHVVDAVRILKDPKGFGLGSQHITLSTSGMVAGIERLIQEPEFLCHLAVSINAPNDNLRQYLMPINARWNLEKIKEAMFKYQERFGKKILIGYVLLSGYNDEQEHAAQLSQYLRGLQVKVNVIPYNAQSCSQFQRPSEQAIDRFIEFLRNEGLYTLKRKTKGKGIMGACGQLGNLALRRSDVRSQTQTIGR